MGDAVWRVWKLSIGTLAVFGFGLSRLKTALPGVSDREIFTYSAKRLFKFAMRNVLAVFTSLESGFFDGF